MVFTKFEDIFDADIKVTKYVGVTKSQVENYYSYEFENMLNAYKWQYEAEVANVFERYVEFRVASLTATTLVLKNSVGAPLTFRKVN